MLLNDVLIDAPTTTDGALERFDAAPAVDAESMVGTWRGAELPTGHPLDGLLDASGWWGKQFVDAETVHPLLFPTGHGTLWAMNPVLAFSGMWLAIEIPLLRRHSYRRPIAALRAVLRTRSPRARLRTTRYRGIETATMIYDQLPINDVFRRIDEDTVLAAMDLRGMGAPYFFVLRRDDSMSLS